MVLSKEAFKRIVGKYPTLLILEDDPAEALHFAAEVMEAEEAALREKVPYATLTIDEKMKAAHEICELCRDVENEEFSEEG